MKTCRTVAFLFGFLLLGGCFARTMHESERTSSYDIARYGRDTFYVFIRDYRNESLDVLLVSNPSELNQGKIREERNTVISINGFSLRIDKAGIYRDETITDWKGVRIAGHSLTPLANATPVESMPSVFVNTGFVKPHEK